MKRRGERREEPRQLKNRVQYLPGIILLVIGGLPLLTQMTEPTRFIAGQSYDDGAETAPLKAEVHRLRGRVAALEAELAALRTNSVLDLDDYVELLPGGGGRATVRFKGVNLQVVNDDGAVLDTAGGAVR